MVRRPRMRGRSEGGDEGHHPLHSRRGVPVGRGADHVPQVRGSLHERSVVGEGVLTSGFTRVNGALVCEGVPLARVAEDVGTPAYVYSASVVRDRFIRFDEVREAARIAADLSHTQLLGLDMHVGSQLFRLDPYVDGTERLVELLGQIRQDGVDTLRFLDIGGGLGVSYDDEESPDLSRFARALVPRIQPTGLTLLMEPGRYIVGNCGVLLTRVLYRKHSGGREFLVTDAGMTELIRPSHYDAYHRIDTVQPSAGQLTADVVGTGCESGAFLALAP